MSDKLHNQIKIAISGKAKSGKNTVACMLAESFGLPPSDYKIVALADPIKQMVEVMFPQAIKECLYGASELRSTHIDPEYYWQNKPLSYRQILIDLGTLGRSYHPDHWIKWLAEDAKKSSDKLLYLCPDVRFVNEFEYLRQSGFFMVRIKREGIPVSNDISETEQDKITDHNFDYVINNNKDLNELRLKVERLHKMLQMRDA